MKDVVFILTLKPYQIYLYCSYMYIPGTNTISDQVLYSYHSTVLDRVIKMTKGTLEFWPV